MPTLFVGAFLDKEVIVHAEYDAVTNRLTALKVENTGKFAVGVTLIDPQSKEVVKSEKPSTGTTSITVTNGRVCKTTVGAVTDPDYEIRLTYPAGK